MGKNRRMRALLTTTTVAALLWQLCLVPVASPAAATPVATACTRRAPRPNWSRWTSARWHAGGWQNETRPPVRSRSSARAGPRHRQRAADAKDLADEHEEQVDGDDTVSNLVIGAVDTSGQASLYNSKGGQTDVVEDVFGYFTTTAG